jgi:hypothetical protein
VKTLDTNKDGQVSRDEFVRGFGAATPEEMEAFVGLMMEYEAVARWVRAQASQSQIDSTHAEVLKVQSLLKSLQSSADTSTPTKQAKLKSDAVHSKLLLETALDDKAKLTDQLRVANEKLQVANDKIKQDKASSTSKEVLNLRKQLDVERGQTVNFKQIETALKETTRKCSKLEADLADRLTPLAAEQLEREVQQLRKQVSGTTWKPMTPHGVDPLLGNLPEVDAVMAKVRRQVLKHVFCAFDVDSNGYVESDELLLLGNARKKLGQKQRDWTEAKNRELLRSLDKNLDGRIDEAEFVRGFSAKVPQDVDSFLQLATEFHQVARVAQNNRFSKEAAQLLRGSPANSPRNRNQAPPEGQLDSNEFNLKLEGIQKKRKDSIGRQSPRESPRAQNLSRRASMDERMAKLGFDF